MALRFDNPPLIELITELKWLPPGSSVKKDDPDNVSIPASLFAPGVSDDLFMRFASKIGAQGFTHSERLMPPGMPAIPFQPVYRYSQGGTKPGATLFQLGAGIFSAHITPPYRRWTDFRPFLEQGISALLEARPGNDVNAAFTNTTVRYLDCFTEEYTEGATIQRFLHDKLGIAVVVPAAIKNMLGRQKEITPTVKLVVPTDSGFNLNLSFASGKIGNVSGVIMDSAAVSTKSIEPDLSNVMQFLDAAQSSLSDCFIEITESIHDLMVVSK